VGNFTFDKGWCEILHLINFMSDEGWCKILYMKMGGGIFFIWWRLMGNFIYDDGRYEILYLMKVSLTFYIWWRLEVTVITMGVVIRQPETVYIRLKSIVTASISFFFQRERGMDQGYGLKYGLGSMDRM